VGDNCPSFCLDGTDNLSSISEKYFLFSCEWATWSSKSDWILIKSGWKNSCASGFRPSLKTCVSKIFIGLSEIFLQFLVCLQSFTESKLFACGLLCCGIFSFILTVTIQCRKIKTSECAFCYEDNIFKQLEIMILNRTNNDWMWLMEIFVYWTNSWFMELLVYLCC